MAATAITITQPTMSIPRIFSPRSFGLLSIACLFLVYSWYSAPVPLLRSPGLHEKSLETFQSNAINNTVVIVPVNTGMMFWAENLLCSLKATPFNTSNIIFWALDAQASTTLSEKGHATYHDPTLFSTSKNENLRGDTKAYKKMMKQRPHFFIDVLSSGLNLLMLDADTVFWQNPLSIVDHTVDVVFSTDSREFYQDHNAFKDARRRGPYIPPICNGFFWMRSSPQTISLWTEMLAVFESWWSYIPFGLGNFQDDQRGMDVLLNDGRAQLVGPLPDGLHADIVPKSPQKRPELSLRVRLLDQTSAVNGHLLRNRHGKYVENLAALRALGQERLGAHFNWDTKVISKEAGARELNMLFVDEHGECKTVVQ